MDPAKKAKCLISGTYSNSFRIIYKLGGKSKDFSCFFFEISKIFELGGGEISETLLLSMKKEELGN